MSVLTPDLIDAYRRLRGAAVSNAIETFGRRLRNEGFADGRIRSCFPELAPVIGHAVTARIRCSTPPGVGHLYYDRTDWWTYIASVPPPRIVVVEDVDERPGFGAFVGAVHAHILHALDCVAYATNGSVRDLDAVRRIGLRMFSSGVSISHAYAHIVEFGAPVTISSLSVASGDTLFGDADGLLTVPESIVAEVPDVARHMAAAEETVTAFCRSPRFSIDGLRELVKDLR